MLNWLVNFLCLWACVRSYLFWILGCNNEVVGSKITREMYCYHSTTRTCLYNGCFFESCNCWYCKTVLNFSTNFNFLFFVFFPWCSVHICCLLRHVWIWDLRRTTEPEQRRESSLKYQTRCIKAFPDGSGTVSLLRLNLNSFQFYFHFRLNQWKVIDWLFYLLIYLFINLFIYLLIYLFGWLFVW
jgi:hypothetical protein